MKSIMLTVLMLFSLGLMMAGVTQQYHLSAPKIDAKQDFSQVQMDEAQSWGNPGDPDIPWYGVKLLLPKGTEASQVNVKRFNATTYKLAKPIAPIQPQYPFSHKTVEPIILPNPLVYGSELAYPQTVFNGVQTHFLSGHSIAFTAISPFEYFPEKQELVFYKDIVVDIDYTTTAKAESALRNRKDDPFTATRLKNSVDNPEAIPAYSYTREDGYEYLLIIDEAKLALWQSLADMYEARGISTFIVPISTIINTTNGSDTQEKVRNYIIDAHSSNPLRYVLLAGDTDVIPHRGFYVNLGAGSESDSDIPADMYYSCLDGNWNTDNDANWGEQYEADLAPEIAIGRICYNSDEEITNQINKISMYQMAPVESSIKSSLFVGEWLWEGPTWGGDYMDEMIYGSNMFGYTTTGVPSSWNISTLYDRTYGSEESWGPNQIRPLLSNGNNLVNHLGHSNTTYNMRLSNNQVSATTITNNGSNSNFSIYFTQGCYAGSFDNRDTSPGSYVGDCISEKFTSIPTAAAGMISHSRYGWGSQGSTNGASQYLHRQYIDAIFGENINELGYTLVDSKIDNIPFITNQAVMYWVTYETNLFGCPAMNIWSDTPAMISVNMPTMWFVGLNNYQIITDAPNASVKLKQNGDTIFEGIADASGTMNIALMESLTPGTYQIYITALNRYPYDTTVNVSASQMPYIICSDVLYDSDDALHHYGELVNISLKVKNVGLVNQTNSGTITLTSSSSNIQIVNGTYSFSALAAGDSLVVLDAFQARIVGTFTDNTVANFTFNSSFDGYNTLSYSRVFLAAPVLNLDSYSVVGTNNFIMPGENPAITFTVSNSGSGTAYTPVIMLFANNPDATPSVMDLPLPQIQGGGELNYPMAFTVAISETAVTGNVVSVGYMIFAENGNVVEGSFNIHVGMLSYSFEPGLQSWSTETINTQYTNQWHRSSNRNNTPDGTYSMKFGGQGSAQYASNGYGGLVSPSVTIAPNSRLKFYHYMDSEAHTQAQYAWDGGLVQMSVNSGAWAQITPVGGYPRRTYNNLASPFPANTYVYSGHFDWTQAVFELGAVSGNVQFRFVFGSDGYVGGEGWYIDDVMVETEVVSGEDAVVQIQEIQLFPNYPNPFNPNTNISFDLASKGMVNVSIFNARGQLVTTLINGMMEKGNSTVVWDGKDANGHSVSSGIYYYRLNTAEKTLTRKMLLLK